MTIREEFDKRVIEIDSFYEILSIIEMDKPKISAYDVINDQEKILQVSPVKIDTLRSTAYLLLYNLVESTVFNSVTNIFDEIKDNGLKYFDIIEDVQKYWINNLYKHDDKKKKETIIETIMKVANQIFTNAITLASNEINYGGSLNAKNIFATANLLKIKIDNIHKMYEETTHGQSLQDVRNKRNWLAHGEKSFIEVGSSSTFSELDDAKKCIYAFLDEYIKSVEDYIINKRYKATTV